MKRTELMTAISSYLSDTEEVSNEATGLKLLRYAYAALESSAPTSEGPAAPAYLAELEYNAYTICAELGILPEEFEEPVASLDLALQADPKLMETAATRIMAMVERQNELERFAEGVRLLLDVGTVDSLEELYGHLESKAQYLAGLQAGIAERDRLLEEAGARLHSIRAKLGIPNGAGGSVEQLEIPAISLLMQQRQAAQDRLAVGRDEAPAEDTLEAIVEQVITILRIDWQDVETLPQQVQQLKDEAEELLSAANVAVSGNVPLAGWVADAVDLAHAVCGNLAPENRVLAKAAQAIILGAPREAL